MRVRRSIQSQQPLIGACHKDVRSRRHASLNVTEELKEMVAKIHDEEEMQMADALNSRQLHDVRYGVPLKRAGLGKE